MFRWIPESIQSVSDVTILKALEARAMQGTQLNVMNTKSMDSSCFLDLCYSLDTIATRKQKFSVMHPTRRQKSSCENWMRAY